MKVITLVIFLFTTLSVNAAPSPQCASKYIGTWEHKGGGTSNIAIIKADGGLACDGNVFCSQGTWDCSGNTMSYRNSLVSADYKMINPNLMNGPNGTVMARVGAAPRTVNATSQSSPEAQQKEKCGIIPGNTINIKCNADDARDGLRFICQSVRNNCPSTMASVVYYV